jgi:hypothetical protein
MRHHPSTSGAVVQIFLGVLDVLRGGFTMPWLNYYLWWGGFSDFGLGEFT